MPTFYLDDKPIEFESGEKVLTAAIRAGYEIPHYCYHPSMTVVATCRMCLIDVVDMGNGRAAPKLMTSCSMDAAEGMKIETKNKKVVEGRELVMEFLLVNHPLDCPICDQSGECTLQDFSNEFGSGQSEMEYSKRVYGYRDIGTFVTLERNRCIHCTRCERFTKEITGTDEFGMFNRGHQLTVDTFTDRPMTNKFQGNMADICPVGCITEREFRFKKRVWHLKTTDSICTQCSTGCNITVEHEKNKVYRLKPRENQEVNQWWMCDDGRIGYRRFGKNPYRILQPRGRVSGALIRASWKQVYDAIKSNISELAISKDEVVAITDTHASNEELFLLKKLLSDAFDSGNVFFPLRSWSQPNTEFAIDSLITTDKTPNQSGAIALELLGDEDDARLKDLLKQKIKFAIIVGNPFEEQTEILDSIAKADLIIHISSTMNEWSAKADVILPGQTHAEKEGTFLNKNKRVQRINIAIKAPEQTKPEWLILTELLQTLGKTAEFNGETLRIASDVTSMLSSTDTFKGLTFDTIGKYGCQLPS